ncbi:MAG: hypothetical protein FWE71_02870 [Nocardioidaceae bacterium]|nr:hypothetical protein [Nocardioidaceae bacterium]MCL2613716.1 hypothetical protein [Nocardioidaceae bacterium]
MEERQETGAQEPEWRRKRRLAEVFGDVLPDATRDDREERDERDERGGGSSSETASDRWLKSQVPPHHGG